MDFTSKLNFPFNCQIGYFRIVDSYNDIVCLSNNLFGELRNLVTWNPFIQKCITLPLSSIKPQSPHMFVFRFGVDLFETDNYKLVRLVYHKNRVIVCNVPPKIEIYSTNRGVWGRLIGIEIKHFMIELM